MVVLVVVEVAVKSAAFSNYDDYDGFPRRQI